MRIVIWLCGLVVCASLSPAWAESAVPAEQTGLLSDTEWFALATKNNCLFCHAIDHKVVGPAYKDVAAAYAGKADMEEKLVKKVSEGGGGHWGEEAMPSQSPPATQKEIRALLRYILSLKKSP